MSSVVRLGAQLVRREVRLLTSLLLRLRGRQQGVPPGATALAYGRDERVTGKALLAASAVELAAVRPHVLTPEALRLRAGSGVDVTVPLDAVTGAGLHRADAARRVALDGAVLVLGSGGQTQVELQLSRPLPVQAGRVGGTVRAVRFSVDDPAGAVAAVRSGCALAR